MGKRSDDAKLMKPFREVIDPCKCGKVLWETEDGFVTNGQWAIKKELLELFQFQSYVKGVTPFRVQWVLEEIFGKKGKEDVEKNVAVYEGFRYYVEREEIVGRRKLRFYILEKLKFYIVNVPVLFRKAMILKTYADFIEAVVGSVYSSEVKRKLYYVQKVKKNGNREVSPYFVWYKNEDVVALCVGCICYD
jgi:hypothetical protein